MPSPEIAVDRELRFSFFGCPTPRFQGWVLVLYPLPFNADRYIVGL
jgi:hypothetical protein